MRKQRIFYKKKKIEKKNLPKSTKTARGTCFPEPVSLKNVLNESSPPPIDLSDGIYYSIK